MKVILG
ncbi:hypothetical protein YPPY53_1759, partial [Yersinia pestis PY-53]